MKKFLIIGSITIAVALGVLFFASIYQPGSKSTAEIITPSPFKPTAEPTPSPTPEIKILESENDEQFLLLGFSPLLDVMTTTQYNYVMQSTWDFFNSLYQSGVRNYPFEQYRIQYTDLIYNKFNFEDDTELSAVFSKFQDVFAGGLQSYIFVFDETSLTVLENHYTYTVEFYVNSELKESFDFKVTKKTSEIKVE